MTKIYIKEQRHQVQITRTESFLSGVLATLGILNDLAESVHGLGDSDAFQGMLAATHRERDATLSLLQEQCREAACIDPGTEIYIEINYGEDDDIDNETEIIVSDTEWDFTGDDHG